MKKILSIICLACLFSACGHDDTSDLEPVVPLDSLYNEPDPFSEIKEAYNINKEGLKIEGWENPIDSICQVDSGTIFIHGRIDGKLWVGCYDVANKTQYLDWTESEKLDTVVTYHKGYGEYETDNIKRFKITDVYKNRDNYCFILDASALDLSDPTPYSFLYYTHLYFITDGILNKKHTRKYPEMRFNKIEPWYDGVLVSAIGWSGSETKTTCYTLTGDSLFTADFNTKLGEDKLYLSPVNREEAIIFNEYRKENYSYYFRRVNIKTGESVWSNEGKPLKQLPNKAKINFKEIKKSGNIWEFICDYILYDGTKGTVHIFLNIDSGQFGLL